MCRAGDTVAAYAILRGFSWQLRLSPFLLVRVPHTAAAAAACHLHNLLQLPALWLHILEDKRPKTECGLGALLDAGRVLLLVGGGVSLGGCGISDHTRQCLGLRTAVARAAG